MRLISPRRWLGQLVANESLRAKTRASPHLGPGRGRSGGVEFLDGCRSRGADALVTFHAWPEGPVGYQDSATRRLQLHA